MVSGLKPSSEKRKGKKVFISEAICADQSHRYEKEESVAPDHDGKAAPYGSGYDKVNEISVPAKFSDEVFKVPPSKMNRDHVLKVAKKYNVDPKLAIQHVNQVGRLKLKEAKLPKRFTVKTKQTIDGTVYSPGDYALKKKRAGGGIYLNMDKGEMLGVDARNIAKLEEATNLWKHFDAKMKLQDEIMDLEMDMKMINKDLSQLHKDMEQEAEPEGGKVATRYGRDIEKKEKEYKKKKAEFKKLMAKLDKMEQY